MKLRNFATLVLVGWCLNTQIDLAECIASGDSRLKEK